MFLKRVFLLFAIFIPLCLWAQRNELLKESLKTLQVQRNGLWNSVPYLTLGSHDFLNISFDDLTHRYCRYRYRIEPMTWDWKLNERLLSSEFLSRGIGDEAIEDFEESLNTSVLYTHYKFRFPSSETSLKLSGNYRIVIYDDDEGVDVAYIPFFVVEDMSAISAQVLTDTDIDFNSSHQQLTLSVMPNSQLPVHYPEREIHLVAMQNLSPLSMVCDPKPDFITSSALEWKHSKDLIFSAGNEFHKFEMTTIRFGGLGMDNVRWFDPYYHASLSACHRAKNYVYDEDRNGAFLIKNIDYSDAETESEYVFVHFFLECELFADADVFIDGAFSNHQLHDEFKMQFNSDLNCYEATVLMKQGYYNYQFLYVDKNNQATDRAPSLAEIQGNFYQTENRYSVFVYFSQLGARYDRLIGLSDFQFMPQRR